MVMTLPVVEFHKALSTISIFWLAVFVSSRVMTEAPDASASLHDQDILLQLKAFTGIMVAVRYVAEDELGTTVTAWLSSEMPVAALGTVTSQLLDTTLFEVAVMVAEPVLTDVTRPDALTVATAVLLLLQVTFLVVALVGETTA